MNIELHIWMEFHKMICPHFQASFRNIYGDEKVSYWHFDGYCKKAPEIPQHA